MEMSVFMDRFVQGLQQPLFPPQVGLFSQPIWTVWFLALVGLGSSFINKPAELTRRQRQGRVIFMSFMILPFVYGSLLAYNFAMGV